MSEKDTYEKIICPCCGKPLPVRILSLEGKLRYSVKCKACGKVSEVAIENIKETI
jgi:transcription elongation factor Elf1